MKTIAGVLKKGRGKRLPQFQLRPFKNGPDGYVIISESADAYVITTVSGTQIMFDICGQCGVHVKNCKCSRGPSLPRSAEYAWDSDLARSKGEEWDHQHPHYKGSFTARETKRNQRFKMPDFSEHRAPSVAPVVQKKKSLRVYVERARKSREEDVQRLLKGRKK